MRELEERKERWKELCDPSDVDDLSSERGDSDQPDIYKPPLEVEEGDVRTKDFPHPTLYFPFFYVLNQRFIAHNTLEI